MPLTYHGEQAVAYPAIFGGVPAPSLYYFGLQLAEFYPGPSSVVAAGTFCIPTAFDTYSTPGTGTNRIFRAVGSGTTDVEPNWNDVAPGGGVFDGTVMWQDVASTTEWLGTSPTFNEVSVSDYARVMYTNNTTNFPPPSGSNPTSGTNANLIAFPTSAEAWGTIAALSIHDALTGGNVIAFAYLSKHLSVTSAGFTPSIPALTGLSLSLI